MTIRQYVRATVALIAAYAVALQTILLVFAGTVPGAMSFAATPICSGAGIAGTGSVPPGHGQDCLTACLTGCCCAAAVPMPGATAAYAPEPARIVIAAIEAAVTPRPGMTAAHRSRAPPLA
jgi:hypothetical protein